MEGGGKKGGKFSALREKVVKLWHILYGWTLTRLAALSTIGAPVLSLYSSSCPSFLSSLHPSLSPFLLFSPPSSLLSSHFLSHTFASLCYLLPSPPLNPSLLLAPPPFSLLLPSPSSPPLDACCCGEEEEEREDEEFAAVAS